MRKILLHVRRGPDEGQTREFLLGRLVLGRAPGPGGLYLLEDEAVSRQHAELAVEGSEIVLRNLSPNGTVVDGKEIKASTALRSGSVLELGEKHSLDVRFAAEAESTNRSAASSRGSGPLANPVVRVVLALYLLGMVVLGVVLASAQSSSFGARVDRLRGEYSSWAERRGLTATERDRQLERAVALSFELRRCRQEADSKCAAQAEATLLRLEPESGSPIYRFAQGLVAEK